MNSAFAIVSLVLQLIPALIAAVKAIEEAIPGQGKGEAKVAAVRQIIAAATDQAAAIWPVLEKVISILVATFNASGVFNKSSQPGK